MSIEWDHVDSATAPGVEATVNGHRVFVSTFDEGPLRPAFYWQIDGKRYQLIDDQWCDGWAGSIQQAKRDSVATAMQMNGGPA